MQRISQRVLRLSLSGSLLALLVLLTFNVGTTQAAACEIATSNPAGTPCTMAIPNIQSTPGPLTYTADASLAINSGTTGGDGSTGTPYTYTYDGTDHNFGISFHTTVSDNRGSLTGWNLAASTNLDPTVAHIILSPSTPITCTLTGGTGCFPAPAALTKATVTLSGTSQSFVGAPLSTTSVNVGNYAITTPGTLTILGSALAGTPVSGTITLTLNNASF